ncbi:MAG: RibD family protein [Pseudomonadota bacterium]
MIQNVVDSDGGGAAKVLADLANRPADGPYVVAQLGQSLDGRIALPNGESRWINGESALIHVHRLRAAVDAVVVGVGTVLADDPQLTVRRVPGRNPTRVVIDPSGKMPKDAKLCTDQAAPVLVIRGHDAPDGQPGDIVVRRVNGVLAPGRIIEALSKRGLSRILIEGGATTVSRFIDAGVVDELHLLVAPMILGSGISGLDLAPIDTLRMAHRPVTQVTVLDDGDVLFVCRFRQ